MLASLAVKSCRTRRRPCWRRFGHANGENQDPRPGSECEGDDRDVAPWPNRLLRRRCLYGARGHYQRLEWDGRELSRARPRGARLCGKDASRYSCRSRTTTAARSIRKCFNRPRMNSSRSSARFRCRPSRSLVLGSTKVRATKTSYAALPLMSRTCRKISTTWPTTRRYFCGDLSRSKSTSCPFPRKSSDRRCDLGQRRVSHTPPPPPPPPPHPPPPATAPARSC